MSRRIAIACLLALSATAALATPAKWNGPGWYRTEEAMDGGLLAAGPFATEADCTATLPAPNNDDDFDYFCRYFSAEPIEYD